MEKVLCPCPLCISSLNTMNKLVGRNPALSLADRQDSISDGLGGINTKFRPQFLIYPNEGESCWAQLSANILFTN